jgi:hypothetical protein
MRVDLRDDTGHEASGEEGKGIRGQRFGDMYSIEEDWRKSNPGKCPDEYRNRPTT